MWIDMIYAIYDIYAFRGGLFAVFPALPKSASRATSHLGGYSYLLLQRLRKTVPLSPCSLMQFGKKNQDPHSNSFKFKWPTNVKNCTNVISSLGQVAHMCHIWPLFNSICDADIEATKCPWSYLSFKLRVQTLHCITKLVPMAMMALPTVVTKTVMMVLLLMSKRLNLSYGERC